MTRSGLVLAGGAARRFGEPKPLALFDGVPMVRRVYDVLATRCDEVLVSVGAKEDPHPFQAVVPDALVVRDGRGDRGPIEGLRQGLRAANGDVVLVAPADAPLLRASLYDALLTLVGDHQAAVPRHESMDPVRALYRRRAALHVLEREEVGSPSALVERLDAVFLEGAALARADPGRVSFVDVNHPEDLAEARRVAAAEP